MACAHRLSTQEAEANSKIHGLAFKMAWQVKMLEHLNSVCNPHRANNQMQPETPESLGKPRWVCVHVGGATRG